MKLKRKFNEELSKITEAEDVRKRQQRIIAKAADRIATDIEQVAEELTDPGAQNPDKRHVLENIHYVLEDIFDQLEVNGWDVDGMLKDDYVAD